MENNKIPIVDCEGLSVTQKSTEIINAIETVGFVYLTNCGFDFRKIADLNENMKQFWRLPDSEKNKFARGAFPENVDHGYVGSNKETLGRLTENIQQLANVNKQTLWKCEEIRESFNAHLNCSDESYPGQTADPMRSLYNDCLGLTLDLLSILSRDIFPHSPEALLNVHKQIGTAHNTSLMRLLHYPPLPDSIKAGTERLGEHSDYGTLTLLFQDEIGGLEIRDRQGQFIPATPMPNAVLVNIGDMMQRWTNDRWTAVRHRVRIPDDKRCWTQERQSIVFFVHPDSQCSIQSAKYGTVNAGDYMRHKYDLTYNKE